MSGAFCPRFPTCSEVSNEPRLPRCEREDCPGKAKSWSELFRRTDPPDKITKT
jgi:hypothetical protein